MPERDLLGKYGGHEVLRHFYRDVVEDLVQSIGIASEQRSEQLRQRGRNQQANYDDALAQVIEVGIRIAREHTRDIAPHMISARLGKLKSEMQDALKRLRDAEGKLAERRREDEKKRRPGESTKEALRLIRLAEGPRKAKGGAKVSVRSRKRPLTP